MSEPEHQAVPSIEELDRLPTEELRDRAVRLAEQKKDVGFFWDLLTHLPPSEEIAMEDGSSGHITGSLSEVVVVFLQMSGRGYGPLEPLFRARFIDYLRKGG